MRIVGKAELMRMPKGTLFADYRENTWPLGPEMIFHSACHAQPGQEPTDFFFATICNPDADDANQMVERCDEMAERGATFPVSLVIQREGLFASEARYLVWEPSDVDRVITLLRGGEDPT